MEDVITFIATLLLKLSMEFLIGGIAMMALTGILFPIFGHPGLSYVWSGTSAMLLGAVLAIVMPSNGK